MELRSGFLSRADLPLAAQLQHVTAVTSSLASATPGAAAPSQAAGQFSWSAGGEVVMGVGGGAPPVPIDTGREGRGLGEEVEVMSTDSSSSSSTDSN